MAVKSGFEVLQESFKLEKTAMKTGHVRNKHFTKTVLIHQFYKQFKGIYLVVLRSQLAQSLIGSSILALTLKSKGMTMKFMPWAYPTASS